MKKQINVKWIASSVLLILFILAANVSMANGIEKAIKLTQKSGKKFSLAISLQDAVDFRIRISDVRNTDLLDVELTDAKDFRKVYDMSQLPVGDYFLEVEDNTKITEWKIQIMGKEMNISQIGEIFIPNFNQQNNMVELSLMNDLVNNAGIKIMDAKGVELYAEDISEVNDIKRIFDFSQVPQGNYLILTRIGDRNFRFYVNE